MERCGDADEDGVELLDGGEVRRSVEACFLCGFDVRGFNAMDVTLTVVEGVDLLLIDVEACDLETIL